MGALLKGRQKPPPPKKKPWMHSSVHVQQTQPLQPPTSSASQADNSSVQVQQTQPSTSSASQADDATFQQISQTLCDLTFSTPSTVPPLPPRIVVSDLHVGVHVQPLQDNMDSLLLALTFTITAWMKEWLMSRIFPSTFISTPRGLHSPTTGTSLWSIHKWVQETRSQGLSRSFPLQQSKACENYQ